MEKEPIKPELQWKDLWEAAEVPVSFILESRRDTLALLLLGLFSASLGALVPLAVGRFVDGLISISDGSTGGLWAGALGVWFLIVVSSALVDWLLGLRATRLGNYVYAASAVRWYGNLLWLPMHFHKQKKGGETLNKISRSNGYVSQLVDNILLNVGPQLLSMCIGIGFAFFLQAQLAALILLGMVVYAFVSIRSALPLAKLQLASNRAWNEAYGDTYDLLGNIQSVKQASAEQGAREKIEKGFLEKATAASNTSELIWVKIRFLQRFSVVVTQLVVFLGSVWFVARGGMTVGDLVALTGYSGMVFGPLASLAMNWNTIQNGLTSIHEVQRTLAEPHEAYVRDGAAVPATGGIEFSHVSFAYPDALERRVLDDVSFTVLDGSTVAFVGESGVGKSTAVELIGGYYYPVSGSVRVGGVATTEASLQEVRGLIAMVPQEPALFNDTVMNNIRFGKPHATDTEVMEAAQKAAAHEFISSFPAQYQQVVGERGVKLSVGQKQRIAIARAVLRNPKILILDEPTSALDAKTETQITASLEDLMRGRTTIIIAHRLSTVRKADLIVVFEGGRVVEQGKHDELLRKESGVYRALYEHQIGLHA